jgi:hypothetical protein
VALPAQAIGLLELDQLPAREAQPVAILEIVTIETPAVLFIVVELDVLVILDQLPALRVRVLGRMALAAGPILGIEGRSGNVDLVTHLVESLERVDVENLGKLSGTMGSRDRGIRRCPDTASRHRVGQDGNEDRQESCQDDVEASDSAHFALTVT